MEHLTAVMQTLLRAWNNLLMAYVTEQLVTATQTSPEAWRATMIVVALLLALRKHANIE